MATESDDDTDGYWAVLEPHWDEVVLEEGPEAFLASFGQLPPTPRILFAAHLSESEIANGGLLQFFCNASGVLAPEAAYACRLIGRAQAAAVLLEAMAFFGEPYPRDRDARLQALQRTFGPDWKAVRAARPFRDLDTRYYAARDSGQVSYYEALDDFAARAAQQFPAASSAGPASQSGQDDTE